MSIPKAVAPQTDFSAGQLDPDMKRSDADLVHAGARTMRNFRILNSKRCKVRPGRSAKFVQGTDGRVEKVRVASGVLFYLCFGGDGNLTIRNMAGAVVATDGVYPWRSATVDKIVWCLVNYDALDRDVIVCFPGMRPRIVRYNSVGSWTFQDFAFSANPAGGVLAPFYRIAAPGTTLQPSAVGGTITLLANGPTFDPAQVGTYIEWLGSQIQITGYTNPVLVTGNVQQELPKSYLVQSAAAGGVSGYFSPGDIIQGTMTNYQAEVVAWNSGTGVLTVNMLAGGQVFAGTNGSPYGATAGDTIVGPTGTITPTTADRLTMTLIGPNPSSQWTELIVGNYRGWPASCFFDQGRLGFTNIPALPRAIAWCAFNTFYAFQVGANATDAILELMSETAQIYHVIPGDGGEIVMTDIGVFYVPINESNPLKPGSVVFKHITPEAASTVQPVRVAEGVLFVNAGRNRVVLIAGTGATSSVRPFNTRDISLYHAELFANIKTLAVASGDGTFPERYVYTLDTQGRIVVGRFDLSKDWIGWTPWTGNGTVSWVSALQSEVSFTTTYTNGAGVVTFAEQLDDNQYLDAAFLVNNVPPGLAVPVGKGPLFWFVLSTVELMDAGTRQMGTYQVDANGFIIPLNIGGEDLASPQLMAGRPFFSELEPFIPQTGGGQSVGQRMRRRKITRWAVTVLHSTGFIVGNTRVPTYRMGDDATLPPPMREETVTGRQNGRDFDPRVALTKDTAGPLTIIEATVEVTA